MNLTIRHIGCPFSMPIVRIVEAIFGVQSRVEPSTVIGGVCCKGTVTFCHREELLDASKRICELNVHPFDVFISTAINRCAWRALNIALDLITPVELMAVGHLNLINGGQTLPSARGSPDSTSKVLWGCRRCSVIDLCERFGEDRLPSKRPRDK